MSECIEHFLLRLLHILLLLLLLLAEYLLKQHLVIFITSFSTVKICCRCFYATAVLAVGLLTVVGMHIIIFSHLLMLCHAFARITCCAYSKARLPSIHVVPCNSYPTRMRLAGCRLRVHFVRHLLACA